jgi:hypothetical protein
VSGTCFVSWLGLAFELRALCLQSRRSTSWATSPVQCWFCQLSASSL